MTSDPIKLLVDTTQQLSLARDLPTIMKVVRTAARNLTGADGATFILKDNDLCYYADEDAISPLWKGQRFPINNCISGWTMIHKQPVVIENIYNDERIPVEAYKPTFVKSLAMVPIRTINPIGAIGNYWGKRYTPSAEEIKILQSLADITSVSIENIYILNSLEQKVKQRTEELEILNKELEAFSYSVSHDLRAPLRGIVGYLGMLKKNYTDKKIDTEGQELIDSTIEQAANMNQLIDELLSFSMLGKKDLKITQVSMKKLATDVFKNFAEHEKTRSIKFEIQDLPDTNGDMILLTQIWTNLISNAIKYTGKKESAEITIGSTTESGKVIYFIKDNGAGFDMKYYHKLFGVFQRLHGSSEFAGNGIGLALVDRIITRHGGSIWAKSELNKGAEFYFSLPN